MEFTAKQLAKVLKGTVDGDPEVKVTSFAKIEHGKEGQLCFFANPKYEHYVYTCKASILLVNNTFEPKQPVSCTMIRVADAYTAVAELLKYVATQKRTDRRHRGFRSSWFLTTKSEKSLPRQPLIRRPSCRSRRLYENLRKRICRRQYQDRFPLHHLSWRMHLSGNDNR